MSKIWRLIMGFSIHSQIMLIQLSFQIQLLLFTAMLFSHKIIIFSYSVAIMFIHRKAYITISSGQMDTYWMQMMDFGRTCTCFATYLYFNSRKKEKLNHAEFYYLVKEPREKKIYSEQKKKRD